MMTLWMQCDIQRVQLHTEVGLSMTLAMVARRFIKKILTDGIRVTKTWMPESKLTGYVGEAQSSL